MLEPSDSQEALVFTRLAFDISEQFDTPVFIRTTTRISHSKSVVELGEPVQSMPQPGLERNPAKLVMLPGNARKRHPEVERRLTQLSEWSNDQSFNRIEEGTGDLGIITSGVSYQYAKEIFPAATILKIGLVHPLPKGLIREFASRFKNLYVIEELDPFIEEQVRAMGIELKGKELLSVCGELTPGRVRQAMTDTPPVKPVDLGETLPNRPPNMCPGCPHRGVFLGLNRLNAYVAGDIGCYTLGFMPPLSAMDTCVCMGASIGNATGMTKVLGPKERKKVVAVIGDSTFLHSGITGLMDMVYNRAEATVIILDNRITAMTGRQENPTSGFTLSGEDAMAVDLEALCRAVGVKNIQVVDPYELDQTRDLIRAEMERPEVSVIITRRPCMLIKRDVVERKAPLYIEQEKCTACKACLKLGCPAIEWHEGGEGKGKARVSRNLCVGCGVCQQVCKFGAIGVCNVE